MRTLLLSCLLVAMAASLEAQTLPRRAFMGIQLENITDDVKRLMGIEEDHGVLINNIIEGSTAEAAGLRKGDILLSINGQKVNNTQEAVSLVAAQKGDTKFSYEIIRDKKKVAGKSTFKEYPRESYPDLSVEYTEVKSISGLQRMIITRPAKNVKLPVLVFIGGIGCYSMDTPMDTTRNETQLLNKLAREGYMAVRVEKPGMGDGAGHSKKCSEISFQEEKDGYVQAIKSLTSRPDVIPDEVYILGHSMGGVMGPLVAAETSIKGIIAYGTIGSNFMEYLLKTRRTIAEAYGWPADETDAYIKDVCECAAYYFIEKMTTEEAAKKKNDCRDYLSVFDYRSRKYNDELYAFNFPALWKSFNGSALLLWGQSDYISAKDDHQILADAINSNHKGSATFAVINNADHGMNYAASFKEARTNPGKYNPEVGNRILAWLQSVRS